MNSWAKRDHHCAASLCVFGLLKGRAFSFELNALCCWYAAQFTGHCHYENLNRLLKLEFISRDVQTIIAVVMLPAESLFIHKINGKMIKLWMKIDLAVWHFCGRKQFYHFTMVRRHHHLFFPLSNSQCAPKSFENPSNINLLRVFNFWFTCPFYARILKLMQMIFAVNLKWIFATNNDRNRWRCWINISNAK